MLETHSVDDGAVLVLEVENIVPVLDVCFRNSVHYVIFIMFLFCES